MEAKCPSAQRESNPHFRHGKAAGSRYIMGTHRRSRIVKDKDERAPGGTRTHVSASRARSLRRRMTGRAVFRDKASFPQIHGPTSLPEKATRNHAKTPATSTPSTPRSFEGKRVRGAGPSGLSPDPFNIAELHGPLTGFPAKSRPIDRPVTRTDEGRLVRRSPRKGNVRVPLAERAAWCPMRVAPSRRIAIRRKSPVVFE